MCGSEKGADRRLPWRRRGGVKGEKKVKWSLEVEAVVGEEEVRRSTWQPRQLIMWHVVFGSNQPYPRVDSIDILTNTCSLVLTIGVLVVIEAVFSYY